MGNSFRLCIAVILVLTTLGCGGNRTSDVSPAPHNSPGTGLISFPAPVDAPQADQSGFLPFPQYNSEGGFSLVHTASATQETVNGNSFLVGLEQGDNNGAGSLPDSYVIAPGENNDLAYAVYGITGLTTDRPVGFDVDIQGGVEVSESTNPLPMHYWVGIANYTNYRWEWRGPYSEPQSLTLNSETTRDRYVDASGTGKMFFAIVTMAGEEFATEENPLGLVGVQVNSSVVSTEPISSIADYWSTFAHFTPLNTLEQGNGKGTSELTEEQFVTVTWEHVFDFDDPDSEALDVRVYRQGSEETVRMPIGKVDSVDNIYVDPIDNSVSAANVIPGDTYQYSIRSFTSAGWSPFTPMEPISIPLLPPVIVLATDATFLDKIVLTWTKADGATSYDVYRDGQDEENLITTLGDVDTFDDSDENILDGEQHLYWIKSINSFAASSFSESDGGTVLKYFPVPDLQTTPDPPAGNFPLAVEFDASASHDPDNGTEPGDGIVKYEFDFGEGNGWKDFGLTTTAQHTYTAEDGYTALLRVTDDEGKTFISDQRLGKWRGDWWMRGHDRRHTGRSQYVGAQTNNVKWIYTTGDGIESSPAIGADGTVYVGCHDGNLYAINPDGSLKWVSYITNGEVRSSPAIGIDGTIYVGSDSGHTRAINPDGTLQWVIGIGRTISSPAIGEDGTIYLGSCGPMQLSALYPDGSEKWFFETGDFVLSSPVIATDGTIYVGSFDNNLYAINPNGTEEWSYPTPEGIEFSSPSIGDDGTIYVGCSDGNLYAINQDGSLKWTVPGGYYSIASWTDGTVYVGGSGLRAFNADGSTKWTFGMGVNGTAYAAPAIGADGTVYVGAMNNKFYAINPDGTLLWSYTTGEMVQSSAAIGADGTIYVGSDDGNLYAFGE